MRTLEITMVKHCPIRCYKYCPQLLFQKRYGQAAPRLSFENFKKALEHTPKDVRIDFSGFSEPFVHAEAPEMLVYAYKQGYPVCVYSTLVGLTPRKLEPLLDLEYSEFVVHLPDSEDIAHINITDNYLKVLLAVKDNIDNADYICMTPKAHPKIRHYFPETFQFIDNMRAGNVGHGKPPYVEDPQCVKLVTPQFVMLPNCDVVLCCMDFGLQHRLGNLLRHSYTSLEQNMHAHYELCHTCLWAKPRLKTSLLRHTTKTVLQAVGLLNTARRLRS